MFARRHQPPGRGKRLCARHAAVSDLAGELSQAGINLRLRPLEGEDARAPPSVRTRSATPRRGSGGDWLSGSVLTLKHSAMEAFWSSFVRLKRFFRYDIEPPSRDSLLPQSESHATLLNELQLRSGIGAVILASCQRPSGVGRTATRNPMCSSRPPYQGLLPVLPRFSHHTRLYDPNRTHPFLWRGYPGPTSPPRAALTNLCRLVEDVHGMESW